MRNEDYSYESADVFTPEKLHKEVERLWPRCRMTLAELETSVWNGLSRYPASAVKDALGTERRSHPDESRPNWKRVYVLLRAHGRVSDPKGRLHWLLKAVREDLRHRGHREAEHWPDDDVFQNHLDAHTYPMTHDTITRAPRDDPDGRRSEHAARRRQQVAAEYREYCEDEGNPVPVYLTR